MQISWSSYKLNFIKIISSKSGSKGGLDQLRFWLMAAAFSARSCNAPFVRQALLWLNAAALARNMPVFG
jgi:hypothetical protein